MYMLVTQTRKLPKLVRGSAIPVLPYSNSLVFSFLSQFFQSTIEFTSLGSE